ncbi:MAG: hypothetical protein ABIP95_12155 [Pelobium sp.]
MEKVIIIISTVILLGFMVAFKFGGLDIYIKNVSNSDKLPIEYQSYQSIYNLKPLYFGKQQMEVLFQSDQEPLSHFISSQNNLIVIVDKAPEVKSKEPTNFIRDIYFYKLDKDSKIIDSMVFIRTYETGPEIMFDDFIVNQTKAYYKTWVLDGDTTYKPVIKHNVDLHWSKEEEIELYENIASNAKYFKVDRYLTKSIIYFLDNKWNIAYFGNEIPYRPKASNDEFYDDNRGETTLENNLFKHYVPRKMQMIKNVPNNIKPLYFQREKLRKRTYNLGGGTSNTTVTEWVGYLYCQLFVNSDTLKFKIHNVFTDGNLKPNLFDVKGAEISKYQTAVEKQYSFFSFYENKDLNFQLFTTSDYRLYIIKPSNKP